MIFPVYGQKSLYFVSFGFVPETFRLRAAAAAPAPDGEGAASVPQGFRFAARRAHGSPRPAAIAEKKSWFPPLDKYIR